MAVDAYLLLTMLICLYARACACSYSTHVHSQWFSMCVCVCAGGVEIWPVMKYECFYGDRRVHSHACKRQIHTPMVCVQGTDMHKRQASHG